MTAAAGIGYNSKIGEGMTNETLEENVIVIRSITSKYGYQGALKALIEITERNQRDQSSTALVSAIHDIHLRTFRKALKKVKKASRLVYEGQ